MGLPFTSLHIGGRAIASCEDGLLGPEYALFAEGDVVPRAAAGPGGVREQGYVTSSAEARARLSSMGITVALAERAAAALAPNIRSVFARSSSVERVVDRLGPYELFEGAVFSAATQEYEGAWLDLGELARATGLPGAALAMQALHLASALSEVEGEAPVFLSTGGPASSVTGERTLHPVSLAQAISLPAALAALTPHSRGPADPAREPALRAMLLERVEARAAVAADDGTRQSLAGLHAAFASDVPMASMPAPLPHSEDDVLAAPARPAARSVHFSSELIESLSLPPGADESMLLAGDRPQTLLQARIACIRLARGLAREYRISHGTSLRADAVAVETMQRHLRLRFTDGQAPDPRIMWELQRHGAVLSEIVARTMAGAWMDVCHADMGYWAMLVPPNTRTWPIGRVYRFFKLGHREKDLVSYYLDLEARTRSAGS